jgi:hypothetical protein
VFGRELHECGVAVVALDSGVLNRAKPREIIDRVFEIGLGGCSVPLIAAIGGRQAIVIKARQRMVWVSVWR